MEQLQLRPEITDIKQFYRYEALQVRNDADCETAALALKEIKQRINEIERQRKEVTAPIKAGLKVFEEHAKRHTDPLERIHYTLKRRVEEYWDAQRAAKEEAARKKREAEIEASRQLAQENLDLAVTTGSTTAQEAAVRFEQRAERLAEKQVKVSQTVRTSGATLAQSTYFDWQLVDLAKVPKHFFILDEKRLAEIARDYRKTPVEIPGIQFVEKSRAIGSR